MTDTWDDIEARMMDGEVDEEEWDAIEARAMDGALTAFEEEEEPTKPKHTTGNHLRSADEY